MYELGGAKQAGSTYAHGGPAGKRGKSLRAHRNFPSLPLSLDLGKSSKGLTPPCLKNPIWAGY